MKGKKTTIHEIAKALNTTASTVSRALNNNPRISEETRNKVLKMAEKLGYEPNTMAASLRRGHSKIIGIIVPYADRIFFSSVIRGIEEEVKKSGYNVIICQSYEKIENEVDDVNALMAAQVAGIIISISRETNKYDHLKKVMNKNKPLVLFDRTAETINTSSVAIDDFQGAYSAVNHLIENGFKQIAFFSGNKKVSIFRERFRGYQAAMRDNNLLIPDEYIIEVPSDVDQGKLVTQQLMSLPNPPDAICSSSDFSALGAIKWLKENNFKVPDDVGVIGFGNDPFTQYLEPTMTSVDQKSKDMGKTAAQVLLEQLEGKNSIARKVLLSPELIIRDSSQKLAIKKAAV
ncbi:LacI family DNA-binding transcriptional regulator [Marinoscillum pacificum]|uniref:LacI family DNA-binding transcriptional regulator n=1 Tax=Marinoscillum pacificum TaxID=392723 RepID=UPI00215752B4|nr:LacI family DNA-binding transcriptional regulator [Marinoscillum pacificum]